MVEGHPDERHFLVSNRWARARIRCPDDADVRRTRPASFVAKEGGCPRQLVRRRNDGCRRCRRAAFLLRRSPATGVPRHLRQRVLCPEDQPELNDRREDQKHHRKNDRELGERLARPTRTYGALQDPRPSIPEADDSTRTIRGEPCPEPCAPDRATRVEREYQRRAGIRGVGAHAPG